MVDSGYQKISQDPEQLAQHYNIIIVGSGLSASITAARLGQVNTKFNLGLHIAVLERGDEWVPGDFPESSQELAKAVRSTRSGKVRNPLGLFETHRSPDIDAVLACGLGGSTLINSGVFSPPDPRIYEQEGWPDELRKDIELGRLDKYFKRAEGVIGRNPRPFHVQMSRYNSLAQAAGLLKGEDEKVAASQTNFDFAINFDETEPDEHGRPQNPCTHCGACMTGCNVGAKKTAVETYLKLAVDAGVEVFTRTEVRSFVRDRGGFSVNVYTHDGKSVNWTENLRLKSIRCNMLVIAAGALGSSEIMLRSRLAWKKHRKSTDSVALAKLGLNTEAMDKSQKAPTRLPTTIGKNIGRNGNAVFAIWQGSERSDVVGHGSQQPNLDYQVGPAVTSALDTTGPLAPFRDGMLIFDMAIPPATVDTLNQALPKGREDGGGGFLSSLVGGLFGSTTGWKPTDPLNHSLLCLVTGHDNHEGQLVFDDKNQPVYRWQRLEDQESYKRVWSTAETMAKNLGGSLVKKPGEFDFGTKPLTFHLLGGCNMSNTRADGVVNDYGAVFNGSKDAEPEAIIPRLFVLGSATIPTSVGLDPALLIAGLSERAAEKIAKKLATGELGIGAKAKR